MLDQDQDEIVHTRVFERARAELGSAFLRILGSFREDRVKAVDRIERAMRTGHTASLLLPALPPKGAARPVVASSLGVLADPCQLDSRRWPRPQEKQQRWR